MVGEWQAVIQVPGRKFILDLTKWAEVKGQDTAQVAARQITLRRLKEGLAEGAAWVSKCLG